MASPQGGLVSAGDAVRVREDWWSLFRGQRGVVVQVEPLMVLLEGEPRPLRFGLEALRRDD